MTSQLYDRVVAITREPDQAGVGFQPAYAGEDATNEVAVASDLPASIQLVREGSRDSTLPGGGTNPLWDVFLPKGAVADGVVKGKDIVTDDLGNRFQVIAPYQNRLGARFRVQTLEA